MPSYLVAFACAIIRTCAGSIDVQFEEVDHSAAWAAAGLQDRFAVVHEHALPLGMVESLLASMSSLQSTQRPIGGGRTMENSWWLPLYDAEGRRTTPRSTVEAAVHFIYDMDFASADEPTKVTGAEWWFRNLTASTSQPVHFDKDEASMQHHSRMRHPEVSTVTYLDSVGAPTLVLNQTIGHGAAEMDPPLAGEALLVYPEQRTHLVFRGNLNHGVTGELLAPASSDEARRVVLLINWWRAPKPAEPVCVPLSDSDWRRRGLYLKSPRRSAPASHPAIGPAELPLLPMQLALKKSASRVSLQVSDSVGFHYAFPPPRTLPGRGKWYVRWPTGAAVGPIVSHPRPASKPAQVASSENERDAPPVLLHAAAASGDVKRLSKLLKRPGVAVDALDARQLTALHVACLRGHAAAAQMLLEHGASPERTDARGMTPLHLAALGASADVARVLMAHGVTIDPIEPNRGATPLHVAATNPEARSFAAVLLQHGASLTTEDGAGDTAAAIAMNMENSRCMELLQMHARRSEPALQGQLQDSATPSPSPSPLPFSPLPQPTLPPTILPPSLNKPPSPDSTQPPLLSTADHGGSCGGSRDGSEDDSEGGPDRASKSPRGSERESTRQSTRQRQRQGPRDEISQDEISQDEISRPPDGSDDHSSSDQRSGRRSRKSDDGEGSGRPSAPILGRPSAPILGRPSAPILLLPDIAPSSLRGDALRAVDWTAKATAHYARGEHELALQHLYAATKVHGFGAHAWTNLGTVLTVVASRHRGAASTELLCEAVAAHELGETLSGAASSELPLHSLPTAAPYSHCQACKATPCCLLLLTYSHTAR